MSMEIGGIGQAYGPGATPVSNTPATTPTPVSAVPDDEAVTVDLQSAPSAIPPEVSSAIALASQSYDRLAAQGQHVSFGTDPDTGELNVQLQSADGSSQSISASDALRLAGGESLGG